MSGVGLHSGRAMGMEIAPAAADAGLFFIASKAAGGGVIPATIAAVAAQGAASGLCTELRGRDEEQHTPPPVVKTVEHVLAALSGCGVDNAAIRLIDEDGGDGLASEVPIMDGSALPFVELIEKAGLVDALGYGGGGTRPRRLMVVKRPIEVAGSDGARALLRPLESRGDVGQPKLVMDVEIDFGAVSRAVGRQVRRFVLRHGGDQRRAADGFEFATAIAPARTFTFEDWIPAARAAGLIAGGSLDNAVVFASEAGGSSSSGRGVLNPGGTRFDDEPVRHKILDCVGDLALAGAPVVGRLHATRPGHALTCDLVRALLASPDNYDLVNLNDFR